MISKKEEKKLLKKIEKIEEGIKNLQLSLKRHNAKIIKRNKKVRFPEHIDILGNAWRIEFSEDLRDSKEKLDGLCQYSKREISLSLSNKDIIGALLHELQHAIDYEFGRVFDEMRKIRGNKHFDEFRVDTLAEIWLGIFRQLRGKLPAQAVELKKLKNR